MNDQHMKAINEWIRVHAEEAQSKLPDDPRHPFGRNAIAHFHTMLQWVFNVRHTKDISDADFETAMEVLNIVLEHAEDSEITRHVLKYKTNTLEGFLDNHEARPQI